MSTAVATRDTQSSTEIVDADYFHPISIFEIERFEQVHRVAEIMARASLIPDHLKSKNRDEEAAFKETYANCFLIANQSAGWGMDPFAVAQATSVVYGKPCYEGKLVRAVIKKKLGRDLHFHYEGSPGSESYKVTVSDEEFRPDGGTSSKLDPVDGDVKTWATRKDGKINDNWVKDPKKMLQERGAREWMRRHRPGLMLGVYTPDEIDDFDMTARSNRARTVNASDRNPLVDDEGDAGRRQSQTVEGATGEAAPATAKSSTGGERKMTSGDTSPQTGKGKPVQGAEQADLTASDHRSYSAVLLKAENEADLKKAASAFWSARGGFPPKLPRDENLSAEIYRTHVNRVAGSIPVADLEAHVAERIVEVFGEDF